MSNEPKNDDLYEKLNSVAGNGLPTDTSNLSTDQKASICVRLKESGKKMPEILEYFKNTGTEKMSAGYAYRLIREYSKNFVSELEGRTFLEAYVERSQELQSRISELSKIMDGELPRYKIELDEDGVEERKRVSGNANNFSILARLRQKYEEMLLNLDKQNGLTGNRDQDMFSTLGSTKPEELKKEDMENMTDSELMVKLIQSLKRQGQSPSSMGKRTLANLKDEKILGN